MRDVRVASVQIESVAGDKAANFGKVERFTGDAAGRGAAVVVFPECCLTGYWFLRHLSPSQLAELAEPVPDGPSAERLLDLARRHGVSVGAGLVEEAGPSVFHNTYVVAMPDGRLVRHRKLHAFEHPAIRSGDEHTVFDTPHGFRAGLLVCYDVNVVENVRILALRGAEVLLAPHQTGGCRTRNPHLMGAIDRGLWERRHAEPEAIARELRGEKGRAWLMRWLPSRAHDNGLFLVFSNGVGVDDDEIRTGNAMVLDPYGRILAESGKAGDDMVVADLDASLLERSTGRLWMQARRPDLYAELAVPTGRERDVHQLKLEE
jgi:predicted amidohydrolase